MVVVVALAVCGIIAVVIIELFVLYSIMNLCEVVNGSWEGVFSSTCPCLIKVVIEDAEKLMRDALRAKSLSWLHDTAWQDFPEERQQAIAAWAQSI